MSSHPARPLPTTDELIRLQALEEAARIAREMTEKHGAPFGDNYTCGVWDAGVRIEQKIKAAATPLADGETDDFSNR